MSECQHHKNAELIVDKKKARPGIDTRGYMMECYADLRLPGKVLGTPKAIGKVLRRDEVPSFLMKDD